MWNSQVQPSRHEMPNSGKYPSPNTEPNSWEELLDVGYLDRQLSQMSFNGVTPYGNGGPVRQQGPPMPLMSIMQPPPPHLLNQGMMNNNGILGRHPPPLMGQPVIVPRPRYQRAPQQFQPHPSNGFVRQPQRMNGMQSVIPAPPPMIDTSKPPPRLPSFQTRPVLIQRSGAAAVRTMEGPLTDTDLSAPFSNVPTVKIVGEDEHRTQYSAPGPKVKILKRPSSTPSNLSSQGNGDGNVDNKGDVNGSNGTLNSNGKSSMKSLKQREEEYAQARLRILGSTGAEIPATESEIK